ncbi:hypothetical protein QTO34_000237 [Cnephaeus nilssonii]|uniref:Iron hydrogenase large subunit C-terminal domain-containing protein n=1 Tax=Cnephaeus nilssonii TaxID=3371016 RepID=A0AA40LWR8_CNENI|nr:hypothetical protein QTO34_000237 [Eptesicus nilssonii]
MYLKSSYWKNVALKPKNTGIFDRKCLKTNAPMKLKEGAEATSKRLAMPENQGCSERLMINISNLMHEINELTKSYKMLHEVEKEAQSEAAAKDSESKLRTEDDIDRIVKAEIPDEDQCHSSWPLPALLQMKCDHCTQEECSKKTTTTTKNNDQENAAVNVRSPAQENEGKRLCGFLKSLGVHCFDMKIAADFSILESQKEFVCWYCQHREEEPQLPMLTSACPGWDQYEEREIVQIMEQSDLASNYAAMDILFGDMKEKEMRLHEGASSNGYLAHIFRHMAKELFNEDVGVLTYHILRNKDFQEVTLERDREALLCFEAAYGFWNIQKWS